MAIHDQPTSAKSRSEDEKIMEQEVTRRQSIYVHKVGILDRINMSLPSFSYPEHPADVLNKTKSVLFSFPYPWSALLVF